MTENTKIKQEYQRLKLVLDRLNSDLHHKYSDDKMSKLQQEIQVETEKKKHSLISFHKESRNKANQNQQEESPKIDSKIKKVEDVMKKLQTQLDKSENSEKDAKLDHTNTTSLSLVGVLSLF